MKNLNVLLTTIILIASCNYLRAQDTTVYITDFGVKPNTNNDISIAVKTALAVCAKKPKSYLVFPKGTYHFIADSIKNLNVGFNIANIKNITIDGAGSEFIFHGKMTIASVAQSDNVKFKNFSVDWDQPYISQGRYVNFTRDYVDIQFDKTKYPFVVENNTLYFTGNGWKAKIDSRYCNLFDKDTKEILYKSRDGDNANLYKGKTEDLGNGLVRFYGQPTFYVIPGTYVIFYAGRYIKPGFNLYNTKNTSLTNITIYHCLSHGVQGVRSENITLDGVNLAVNEKEGRVFSNVGDGFHFTNCKGLIKVTNCAPTGEGDDFFNAHGYYGLITKIIDRNTVEISGSKAIRAFDVNRKLDEIWFINKKTIQRGKAMTISDISPIKKNGTGTLAFTMTFTEPIPPEVQQGDYLENKTWNPDVEITNNKILKKNRGRGILVTTPGKVTIENNYFRTAGAAILLEGDTSSFFESGADNNVLIKNNTFEDCLTSGISTENMTDWGLAIITIKPSHHPSDSDTSQFHSNIKIDGNIFKTFDVPLLMARSVKNLSFTNNKVIKTYTFKAFLTQKPSIQLDGCKNVTIGLNTFSADYTKKSIESTHMINNDLKWLGDSNMELTF